MNKDEVRKKVDRIIASVCNGCNDEIAHYEEDQLHLEIIEHYCPAWLKKEVKRLSEADFSRWYS